MNRKFYKALQRAIREAGSQTALARRIGCAPATVSNWLNGRSRPEALLSVRLEELDLEGAAIPRHVSRPDLWPNRRVK